MPFGAIPVWPCRKSQKPIPRTVTGVEVVLNDVVAVKRALNSLRALLMPGPNGLPAPTQFGEGISMTSVRPELSTMTR